MLAEWEILKITVNVLYQFIIAFKDCLPTSPNHAVTIVGQTENQDWIVRNSWG